MLKKSQLLIWAILLSPCVTVEGQTAKQIVNEAVRAELYVDNHDHTHWLYYEADRKPGNAVEQWVAETSSGDLTRVIEQNGLKLTTQAQRNSMNSFSHSFWAQSRQRRNAQHDDRQATQMLSMLPQAFEWSIAGTSGGNTTLHFWPNPQFRPPTWQARVFAAMAGEMVVDNRQHRIVSLKGHLIHDVKFWGGLLGDLEARGTFDVERREVGHGEWKITETHVHIQGHALIFKSISEQEDDEKSQFKELPANVSLQEAENDLLAQNNPPLPKSTALVGLARHK